MKTILFILILVTSCTIFTISCSKGSSAKGGGSSGGGGNTLDCSSVPKSYATNVDPIVQSFCNAAGCHAMGSTNGPGPLTNYTQVFNARTLIRSAISSGLMPQGSSLSTAQKNSFLCWIDSGAPQN